MKMKKMEKMKNNKSSLEGVTDYFTAKNEKMEKMKNNKSSLSSSLIIIHELKKIFEMSTKMKIIMPFFLLLQLIL